MLLTSIVSGIAMAMLVIIASYLFNGGNEYYPNGQAYGSLTVAHVIGGIFLGALVWAIYYFSSSDRVVAIVGTIIVSLLIIMMVVWSLRETSRWYEALVMSGIIVILCHLLMTTISRITSNISWSITLPSVVLIVALAIIWIGYFIYHYYGLHLIEPVINGAYLVGAIITAIVAIILIICLLTGLLIPASARGSGKKPSDSEAVVEEVEIIETTSENDTWYHFYNSVLQKDKDSKNDFNFGPDPTNKNWKVKEYEEEFRRRIKYDPALAAADMAWLDANVGTRYLGEFYESCKEDWAKTMNLTKERFMADQIVFYKHLDAFFAFLDSADKVEIRECKSVSDQMYMNPYTVNGVPDIIVMLTDDHSGYELVYTFVIKDNVFEVAYRINCGYQPTDVSEIMNITPQPKPEKPTPENPTEPPTEPPTVPSAIYSTVSATMAVMRCSTSNCWVKSCSIWRPA